MTLTKTQLLWLLGGLVLVGLPCWTIYDLWWGTTVWTSSRFQSELRVVSVQEKAMVLGWGDQTYPVKLTQTAGLRKPLEFGTYSVLMQEPKAGVVTLSLCSDMRSSNACYYADPDVSQALIARLRRNPTVGEVEQRRQAAIEADTFKN